MYSPPAFRVTDHNALIAGIEASPFSTLVVVGEAGPVAAHLPWTVERTGEAITLVGHLARANPIWKAADLTKEALVIFMGPNAYVSPTLYPSKAEHGRVVPTWNYLAIEARGALSFETNPEAMAPYLASITDAMEARNGTDWQVSDTPAQHYQKLTTAIVGVRLNVTALCGKRKLDQHKPTQDFEGVLASFSTSNNQSERALATEMHKEKVT